MGSYSQEHRSPNGMWTSFTKTWHEKPYAQISPTRPELSAAGKIVFVTGGGTGIGKATATAFAQAGAKGIAIFGRRLNRLESAAEEIRKASPKGNVAVAVQSVDLSQRSAVETAFAEALKELHATKVDVFISNAFAMPAFGTFADCDPTDFLKGLELNIFGAFNALQTVLPKLTTTATVIDVSSGIGHIGALPGVWAYAAQKGANIKMFEYLQSEHPHLRVLSVQPGVIETELNQITGQPGQDDVSLPAQFQVWLTSPEAEFLKGKFVWVNWDVDELKARAEEIKGSTLLKVNLQGVPM